MGFVKEFRKFAVRGSVVDMAVRIIIGGAFGTVVSSFVNDVMMPPLGMLVGDVDFQDMMLVLRDGAIPGPYETLAAAKEAGAVTLCASAIPLTATRCPHCTSQLGAT